MSVTADDLVQPSADTSQSSPEPASDRRADIDAKQARIAALLEETGCEGLLVVDPDNVAWLTSGAAARGILEPDALPALYFSPEARWALSGNLDSQRLFDEELDGLGFQLKEWPWHWGRAQLLADICQGRSLACDQPQAECRLVAESLRRLRRTMTPYEQACYRALGQIVSHAVEACCRTMNLGETEREVAGQLAHRLMHRGAQPLLISVAADGRSKPYRSCGYTGAPIRTSCVLTATARKYGLCASVSRSVFFETPPPPARKEHEGACKVSATYLASTWPDAVPRQILSTARRVYLLSGFEHEWLLAPQGYLTGRAAVEMDLTPKTEDLFQAGWAVTWRPSVGAALSCDTFLITDKGPVTLTPTENWPLKRIRIQGAEFVRPDLLVRE
jgi:Xaa-Pro aminopeptidase